jgi:hypothetical protein
VPAHQNQWLQLLAPLCVSCVAKCTHHLSQSPNGTSYFLAETSRSCELYRVITWFKFNLQGSSRLCCESPWADNVPEFLKSATLRNEASDYCRFIVFPSSLITISCAPVTTCTSTTYGSTVIFLCLKLFVFQVRPRSFFA